MSASVTIEGLGSAKLLLQTLPEKFQVQIIKKMFRKAVKPVIDDAKSRLLAHDPAYKKLSTAIGVIPTSDKIAMLMVGIRAKGQYKDIGFIGHWVEYGVSGIKLKSSKTLTKPEDESYRIWVSKVQKGQRYRHDIPPQPFMRPAVDSRTTLVQNDVLVTMEKHLNTEVEKQLAKGRGRDTWTAYAKAKGR